MKKLFGFDVTESAENAVIDGQVFCTKHIAPEHEAELEELNRKNDDFEKESVLPLPLRILSTIFTGLFVIAVTVDVRLLFDILAGDLTISQAYHNAPFIFYAEAVVIVLFAILTAAKIKQSKKVFQSTDYADHTGSLNLAIDESFRQLGIPENASVIDVLMSKYRIKNGKEKQIAFFNYNFINVPKYVYIENACICFADAYEVLEIPLSSVKSIKKVKKRAMFPNWNKNDPPSSKNYKKYKIAMNNQNVYYAHYYSVLIEDIRGDFELFIPNYDIETFSALTAIRIDED